MTISEALSLRLVEDTIKPLLPVSMLEGLEARFRQAEKQLAALSKENRRAKWVDKERKVILVGDAVMRRLERGDWDEVDFRRMMDEALSRPVGRALFDLD